VQERGPICYWSQGIGLVSPERHGAMTGITWKKPRSTWIPYPWRVAPHAGKTGLMQAAAGQPKLSTPQPAAHPGRLDAAF